MKRPAFLLLALLLSAVCLADEIITVSKITSLDGLPGNDIQHMSCDSTGFLYFTFPHATYKYDGYDLIRLPFPETRNRRRGIGGKGNQGVDNNGNRYRITPDGKLVWTNRATGETVSFNVLENIMIGYAANLRHTVIVDRRGLLWASVYGNGLFAYDRKNRSLRHFRQGGNDGIIDCDLVNSMLMDNDGNIWVSQERFGVACLRAVPQRNVSLPPASTNRVSMIWRMDKNDLAIADSHGRLYRSDGNLRHVSRLANDEARGFACRDLNGRLWTATDGKGVCINGRQYGNGSIRRIMCDNKGRMWLCRDGGGIAVATLSAEGKYIERSFLAKEKHLVPRAMAQDGNGNIWVGGEGGLYRFKPERLLVNADEYSRISDKPVRSLLIDSGNQIWVGMENNGVVYGPATSLDASRLRRLTIADGLPDNGVLAFAEDRQRNIYIITRKGCAVYDPSARRIFSFNPSGNAVKEEGNDGGAVLLNNGDMAIATDGDLRVIAMQGHEENGRKLVVSDMEVNGMSVYGMGEASPVSEDISLCKEISLAHSQNSVVIKFSPLYYGTNGKAVFSCKLNGYDNQWSQASSLNFASYKNLPAGSYRLLVRCKDSDGNWSQAQTLLTLSVSPPWWATWWAVLLYIAFAILVTAIVYDQTRRVLRLRQNVALEKQMTNFKLAFFTDISHEFRTPLTLIQASIDHMRAVGDMPNSLRGSMSSLERSARRMMRLVNQLLEFRRMQAGKTGLALQETDLVPFLYNIWTNFHDEAENRKIGYQFLPQQKSIVAYIDRGHVDKIVYNLLSNAFKYTPKNGTIQLTLKIGRNIEVSVSDTGVGISLERQADLFARYASGKVSANSMGIGLNLSLELAKAHHGSITYKPNGSKGSIFMLTLPAGKEAYQPADFMRQLPLKGDGEIEAKAGNRQTYRETLPEPMNDKRVLVVEDDADVRNLLLDNLAKYFIVTTASDGNEAMKELERQSYDLIVTDVMMPNADGWQLLRAVRKNPKLKTTPVVMLTAITDDSKKVKALDEGADAYIAKPFHMDYLVAQCASLIKKHDTFMAASTATKTADPRQPSTDSVKEVIRDEWEKRFVERLDIYINAHIADTELGMDDMASTMQMGRTTFFTTVKRLTGKPPHDYLRERRLYKAAECLREENITVAEAAYRAGFANVQHFSTIFKKKFGMTPRQYQRGS